MEEEPKVYGSRRGAEYMLLPLNDEHKKVDTLKLGFITNKVFWRVIEKDMLKVLIKDKRERPLIRGFLFDQ